MLARVLRRLNMWMLPIPLAGPAPAYTLACSNCAGGAACPMLSSLPLMPRPACLGLPSTRSLDLTSRFAIVGPNGIGERALRAAPRHTAAPHVHCRSAPAVPACRYRCWLRQGVANHTRACCCRQVHAAGPHLGGAAADTRPRVPQPKGTHSPAGSATWASHVGVLFVSGGWGGWVGGGGCTPGRLAGCMQRGRHFMQGPARGAAPWASLQGCLAHAAQQILRAMWAQAQHTHTHSVPHTLLHLTSPTTTQVRLAVFSQHHVDGLDLALTPLQYMLKVFPQVCSTTLPPSRPCRPRAPAALGALAGLPLGPLPGWLSLLRRRGAAAGTGALSPLCAYPSQA